MDVAGIARELVAAVPSPVVREALQRVENNEIFLKYDWIVNWDRFNELLEQELIDFRDGSTGLVLLCSNNNLEKENTL